MVKIDKRFAPCPRCGKRSVRRRVVLGRLCSRCEQRKEEKSPHLAGKGHAHSDRMHQCRMPKCRKWFKLRWDQDPRFTWYCHDCREKIVTISDGVNWLNDMGIEVPPEED